MLQQSFVTRRRSSRVKADTGVWVYWRCKSREDVCRVRDLSAGGVFIETETLQPLNLPATLHFLVEEGQIRADAVVRHVKPGTGIGLQFTALSEMDRPHLRALLARLRSSHQVGIS